MEYHYKHSFLVGYGEVDEHNRMRLSALLNYLQDMATMHSKMVGYSSNRCSELGIAWLLLSWHIKIYSYPKADMNIEIKTWSRKIKGAHAFRGFEVEDENGNLVAHADSMWALVNIDTGRPLRPFDDMLELYGEIDRTFFDDEKVRIDIPEKIDSNICLKIQRRDIDTNRHCNNTKYIEFALEIIPEDVYHVKNVSELEIVYKKQVVYGDSVDVSLTKVDENKFVNVIRKEDGEVATLIRTSWE